MRFFRVCYHYEGSHYSGIRGFLMNQLRKERQLNKTYSSIKSANGGIRRYGDSAHVIRKKTGRQQETDFFERSRKVQCNLVIPSAAYCRQKCL